MNNYRNKAAQQFEKRRAEPYEPVKAERVVEHEENILGKARRGALRRLFEDVKLLWELVKSFRKGEYTEVPYATIAAAVAALLYVLNPLDVIPDVIPGLGLVDDAVVVRLCLSALRRDLRRFTQWRAARVTPEQKALPEV